jgi:hypothetical protein
MRKKMSLRLSLLTVFLTLLWSCHNEDFAKGETAPQRNNSEFFTHAKKGGANAKSGVDYIDILEAYNRDKDFLSQMPDQKGMPIWNKMYTVDTESATGLMIPLSYDDETMSSILFVTLDSKNEVTGVKDYDNTLLQNIVYDQKISKENRENLFLTFMQMDNRTFGNEHFIGIPKDLFVGKKSDDEYGIMWVRNFALSSTVTTDETGKLMIIESCFIALHCTHHGGGNICDAEDGCTQCGTTFCTYEVIGTADDPFPSSPSGGGGGGGGCSDCGGGGTTPGPNVPTNPCGTNLGTVFYRLAPGCGENTDLPDLKDPCEKTKNMLANPQVQAKIDEMKTQSTLPDSDPNKGETGYKFNADGTPSPKIIGGAHEVSLGSTAGYQGGYHNHTLDGIKMLAPADIAKMLQFAIAQPNGNIGDGYLGMVGVGSDGTQYHYVIHYTGNMQDLSQYIYNNNWDLDQLKQDFGIRYGIHKPSNGNMTNSGLEKLFFKTLKDMGLENKVSLQRVENDGVIKTITNNNDGTVNAIPCPQ